MSVIRTEEEHLAHYGILRRSGRYPWGSGSTENVRNKSFLDYVKTLKEQGMTETEIARGIGISRNDLTATRSIALSQQKQQKIQQVRRLRDRGWGWTEIGRRMDLPESSVRALHAPTAKDSSDALHTTANMLKNRLTEVKYLDVGKGVETHIGVTRTRLDTAIAVLKEQGYVTHNIQIQQVGTGKYTKTKVLAPPGTKLIDVQRNRTEIKLIADYSDDGGRSFFKIQPPISVSSRRIGINYAEDGGSKADGVIYIRPGAKDLDLGSSHYSQVRILVDGTHFLKGMAVRKEGLPEGTDILFNTNKSKKDNPHKKDVLKPLEDDPDLPFGSIVRQIHGPDGKVRSALNLVGSPTKEGSGEEGQWDNWSRTLSTQVLSKQSPDLARRQLGVTYERRVREFDEINSLTNPTVKKQLLTRFADETDSAAVHLKSASLPRQSTKVLLPVASMKPGEVYAPSMRDGETVALIRYPHGGTFEIPTLVVNNKNREARKMFGSSASDVAGVHHTVAERLSGADFDGDTVLVIPNGKKHIATTDALDSLKGFDPQVYKIPKGSGIKVISESAKQFEMGKISNLITDMTLHGASTDEIARAVKHSMVVIDSKKHELDHLQSEKDHGILQLKEKYQGGSRKGASTLISRGNATVFIPQKEPRSARRGGPIDPNTGAKVFEPTGQTKSEVRKRLDPATGRRVSVETGRQIIKTQRSRGLAETDDAFTLVSKDGGTRMEQIYANHSNRLKSLANAARKESLPIKGIPRSSSAAKVYVNEVTSLNAKLNLAKKNAPLERQAQLLAQQQVSLRKQANPDIEKDDLKKIKQQALNEARSRTGAQKTKIQLTQEEWNAIQAGAISPSKLDEILYHSDSDTVKRLALPKTAPVLSRNDLARAQQMLASGYTQAEVADHLGVGLTTLKVNLND